MNNYVIKLLIKADGYQDLATLLAQASNEAEAGLLALRKNTHNDPDRENIEGEWGDDGRVYEVIDVYQVSDEDYKILRQHI